MPSTITEPVNARSRRTRTALLDAARAILEAQGAEALTMAAVADRAGVTRRAAYLHFGSRGELVGALFDHLADAEGLEDSLASVWAAPDAGAALDAWAAHLARYHPRLLAVDRALRHAVDRDTDAAAHYRRVHAEQIANTRRLVRRLVDDGRLASGWTPQAAADMLFALISSDTFEALLIERRWSRRRLADHLALLLRSTFLRSTS